MPQSQQSKSLTTDAEIEAALEAARLREEAEGPDPWITSIDLLEEARILVMHLNSGVRVAYPVENLQGLENATPAQLRNYHLLGRGYGIDWPDLDAALHLDGLLEGRYGNSHWMAALNAHIRSKAAAHGSKGGASRSDAKTAAARANGTKGGRPRKIAGSASGYATQAEAIAQAKRLPDGATSISEPVSGPMPSPLTWTAKPRRFLPRKRSFRCTPTAMKPLAFQPYGNYQQELDKRRRSGGRSDLDYLRIHAAGRTEYPDRLSAARIPVERFRGKLLLIAGEGDTVWPSAEMARHIARSRAAAGRATKLLIFPNAEHALGGPGTVPLEEVGPVRYATIHARRTAWEVTGAFFAEALKQRSMPPTGKR